MEYIEGYSGHADQTWLLNFVYSFTNPPKNIFLVHGEAEGQEEFSCISSSKSSVFFLKISVAEIASGLST